MSEMCSRRHARAVRSSDANPVANFALEPAAMESERHLSAPLDEALTAISKAAHLGMEKTRDMAASVGKAKTLGERSLGHPDPGAISMALIFEFMAEYVAQKTGRYKS